MSDSFQLHGLQHASLLCPSPTPGAYSNSCPSNWWCHPTISSSVIPFSSCLQSFPGSGSFPMSQFFSSGGQSIESFSFSISPSNEHSGLISFRIYWLDLLAVQGALKSLLQHHSLKASVLWCSSKCYDSAVSISSLEIELAFFPLYLPGTGTMPGTWQAFTKSLLHK